MRLFCTVITIISCVSLSASAVCFRLKFTFIIKTLIFILIYFGVKKWCQNSGQDVYGSSGIHKRSQSWLWNISPIVRKLFQNNGKTLFLVLYSLYPKSWESHDLVHIFHVLVCTSQGLGYTFCKTGKTFSMKTKKQCFRRGRRNRKLHV